MTLWLEEYEFNFQVVKTNMKEYTAYTTCTELWGLMWGLEKPCVPYTALRRAAWPRGGGGCICDIHHNIVIYIIYRAVWPDVI